MSLAEQFNFDPNVRTIQPGEIVFREGEPADYMYVVLDGAIEIQVEERSIGVVRGSTIIGEMALVDRGGRSASIVAVEETRIVAIDRKRFLYLIQNTPTFALDVMTLMATRLRSANHHLAHLADTDL